MLQSAFDHYERQQRLNGLGLLAARRARKAGSLPRVVAVVTAFQLAAARDAVASVPLMLAEQGLDAPAVGGVNVQAFSGVASDGRALDTLMQQAETDTQFALIVATQFQDMARLAAHVGLIARPNVGGYTRMLNPPSCSRCAVQAGRFFRWNAGFERHPKCDCRHVPTADEGSAQLEGLISDPHEYFDGLSKVEQDRVFTQAGARAIRDGADMGQVVNARRGAQGLLPAGGRYTLAEQKMLRGGNEFRGALERVDVYGHQVFITREGITRRGLAGKAGRSSKAPRLMPESIYEIADDRADAIRLLRLHGYLF